MKIDLGRLCRQLGYEFTNPKLLQQALTHCSAGSDNYERFEFVGDSILSLVIAHELFKQFPQHSEGQLSRLRAFLVKGEMLSQLALEIGLGDYLILGQGELKSGGFRRASILADSLEAIFAAIYFDGGLDAVKKVILKIYQSRLLDPEVSAGLKDSKTQLQEYLQSHKLSLPQYKLTHITGDEHDQIFHISCTIPGRSIQAQGQAATRRKAEQLAAKLVLEQLLKEHK